MAVRKTYPTEIIGGAKINNIIKDDEFFGKGRMYAHVRLDIGEAVDWHIHTGETEYYYIISGNGVFVNSDRTECAVKPGDVCTMEIGGGHAIKQCGDSPLEFMALVIYTD